MSKLSLYFCLTDTVGNKNQFSIFNDNILDTIENGRAQNEKVYQNFLMITMKCIVGARKWKRTSKNISHLFNDDMKEETDEFKKKIVALKNWTDSDEAFAVTILANNIDVWKEKLNNTQEPTAKQKYTKVITTSSSKKRKCHKWTNEGIEYYNERLKLIMEQRKKGIDFDYEFLKSMRKNNNKTGGEASENRVVPLIDPAIMEMI